ncbi:hypothetical protein WICPIJ_003181 [Wickerhamomyces pijperi]|uniref:Uncharacterized protein n=1 Tax=Wickerhamomyces pijperi TaxID=599730 RepID=A0A9P8QAF1_WICPI|nr:hypothetical protein WICPIJ_003181 [Wickerhamomyces pijperi]
MPESSLRHTSDFLPVPGHKAWEPTHIFETLPTAQHIWHSYESDLTKHVITKAITPLIQREPFKSRDDFSDMYKSLIVRVFETYSNVKSLCEAVENDLKNLNLNNELAVRFHVLICRRVLEEALDEDSNVRKKIVKIIQNLTREYETRDQINFQHQNYIIVNLGTLLLVEESGGPPVEEQEVHEKKRSASFLKLDSLQAENVVSQSSIPLFISSIIRLPQQYVRIREYRTCTQSAEVNYFGMGWDFFAHTCYLFCTGALLVYGVNFLMCYHQDLKHGAVKVLSQEGTVISFNHLALQSSIPHLGNATIIPCLVASFVVLIQKVLNPELFN